MKIIKSPKIDAKNSFKKKLLLVGIALLLLSLISLTAQTSKHSFRKAYGQKSTDHVPLHAMSLTDRNAQEIFTLNASKKH
jgi:hypothetical protein